MRFSAAGLLFAAAAAAVCGNAGASVLYVADDGARAVFGYALHEGLPSNAPATTLSLDYAPRQIALAPDGVYVESQFRKQVNVFAFGARGRARPTREVDFDAPPTAIASDLSGYLYVAFRPGTIDMFAPNARGHAKPIGQMSLGFSFGYILSLALDQAGRLFISTKLGTTPAVFEYANPLTTPAFIRTIGEFFTPPLEMAIDPTDELYGVGIFNESSSLVLAMEPTSCCYYPADRELSPLGVTSRPTAIAIEGRHAFLLSYGKSVTPAIYTLDLLQGAQTPLSTVSGPNLNEPAFEVVAK